MIPKHGRGGRRKRSWRNAIHSRNMHVWGSPDPVAAEWFVKGMVSQCRSMGLIPQRSEARS